MFLMENVKNENRETHMVAIGTFLETVGPKNGRHLGNFMNEKFIFFFKIDWKKFMLKLHHF